MANILLFEKHLRWPDGSRLPVEEDRENVLRILGHDVFSFPDYSNFLYVMKKTPDAFSQIDLIVTGMSLHVWKYGDHIRDLRINPKLEGRFSQTPIIAYSVMRDYSQDFVVGQLGATEFIELGGGNSFATAVVEAVKRYVPDVPGEMGKLAVYNPLRAGSLIT